MNEKKQSGSIQNLVKRRFKAFAFAFQGVNYLLQTQPNVWIHAFASICAIGLSLYLNLNRIEWSLILIAIVMVWMAEAFNTAIEAVVNLTSPEIHPLAKMAKDCAAAGVLFAAIGAAAIGFLVFLPLLLLLFN